VTPVSSLQPETDLIPQTAPGPDPASTDYLLVTQSQNNPPRVFNGVQRNLWDVDISGKTVIFDSSSALYGQLFLRFNNRPDVLNLTIYAVLLRTRCSQRGCRRSTVPGAETTISTFK
jgi:hypothetical protein